MKRIWFLSLVTIVTLSSGQQIFNNSNNAKVINSNGQKLENSKNSNHNTDITTKIDYHFSDSYISIYKTESSDYITLRWKDYADDWQAFKEIYPNFTLSGIIFAGLEGWTPIGVNKMGYVSTSKLNYLKRYGNFYFFAKSFKDIGMYTRLWIKLWYDDENVCFYWNAEFRGSTRSIIGIKADAITFHARK